MSLYVRSTSFQVWSKPLLAWFKYGILFSRRGRCATRACILSRLGFVVKPSAALPHLPRPVSQHSPVRDLGHDRVLLVCLGAEAPTTNSFRDLPHWLWDTLEVFWFHCCQAAGGLGSITDPGEEVDIEEE